MAGYYVPSNFSANYVSNKKNEDGTYTYDSAVNRAGIDAQRNLQQLNKQYNQTINNAYAQHLMANKGLRASTLGSGYKEAYVQQMQGAVDAEINQVDLSVHSAKQNIFASLANNLGQIGMAQQQEVGNMRRMAGSLEKYHDYLKTLTAREGNSPFTSDQGFKIGDEWTFEDNYDKLLDPKFNNKANLSRYKDEYDKAGLAFEDWLRMTSGNTDKDTSWLDWVYTGGINQYKDFIKNGVNRGF